MSVVIALAFTSLSSTIAVFPLVGFPWLERRFRSMYLLPFGVSLGEDVFFWAGKATYGLADVLISGLPRGPDSTVV